MCGGLRRNPIWQGVPNRGSDAQVLYRVGIRDIIPVVSSSPLPLQALRGVIERITFYKEDKGYTVARLVPEGQSSTATTAPPSVEEHFEIAVQV